MMNRIIQAVLFDLGDTLMYSPATWLPVFSLAGNKLSSTLSSNGVLIDEATFQFDFLQRLDQYYTDRERDLRNNYNDRFEGTTGGKRSNQSA